MNVSVENLHLKKSSIYEWGVQVITSGIYQRSAYNPVHPLLPHALGARISQRRAQLRGLDGVEWEGLVVLLGFCVKVEKLRLHHVEQGVVALHPRDGKLPSGVRFTRQ